LTPERSRRPDSSVSARLSFDLRNKQFTIAAALFVIAPMLAACSSNKSSAPPKPTTVTVGRAADSALALQSRFVRVVRNVSPSVVLIETNAGLGSGVVYDDNGNIVTNAHVVAGANTFTVTLANGHRHPATLLGSFPPNDLAVVHVEGDTPPPAHFGHSKALAVGDIVFAIGNPLGLRSSVTEGIISSLGRTVSEGNGIALPSVIQTSAAINPGNSGGALVDLESEVIGIPTLAALDPEFGQTPAAGIGFAIPSDAVKLIADQLISSGKVTHSGRAFLGVRLATTFGGGAMVASVEAGGPADSAGIAPGDVIVAVDKTPVTSADELAAVLAPIKPGKTVQVEVVRNGKKLTFDVKVGQLKSG
jgi:putative serine protease PepD